MYATQVLLDNDVDDVSKENDDLEVVGFLIVDNKKHEIRKGENKIGRDPSICSVVLENHAVSKFHAVIECEGADDTFIFDVGSTNQTKLGKKCLKPQYRYKVDSNCEITLGNVVAKFIVLSESEKSTFKTVTPPDSGGNSTNFGVINKFDDIFDVSTQVTTSQPCRNITVAKFELLPENFQVFKLPQISTDQKQFSLNKQRSCLDSVTQLNLNMGRPDKPNFFGVEDPCIYSLSTQCQIPLNSSIKKEVKNEHKLSDRDKIKSLLNDGQDDVLCTFMSMHSPSEQKKNVLLKDSEIKTEVETEEDICDKHETPQSSSGYLQEKSINSNEIEQLKDLLTNGSFGEDFCCSTQAHSKQVEMMKETHLFSKENCIDDKKGYTVQSDNQHPLREELTTKNQTDFITSSTSPRSNNKPIENLSQNSNNSYLEITLEEEDRIKADEDFIITQTFVNSKKGSVSGLNSVEALNKVLKLKEEITDDISNFHFKKENICGVVKSNVKNIQKTPSFVVEESSDEETQCYIPQTESSPQRGDDFTLTQVQNSERGENIITEINKIDTRISTDTPQSRNKNAKSLDNTSSIDQDQNCEDFIATQTPDKSLFYTNEEIRTDNFNSREGSPDLLSFEYPNRETEDFINTQVYEVKECKNKKPLVVNFSKTVQSIFSRRFAEENENPSNVERIVHSKTSASCISGGSGDETETDLEVSANNIDKSLNLNSYLIKVEKNYDKEGKTGTSIFEGTDEKQVDIDLLENNDDSNFSYVFDVDRRSDSEQLFEPTTINIEGEDKKCTSDQLSKANFSDSDVTDCEDVVVMNFKDNALTFNKSPNEMAEEETQVLTLTLLENFVEKSYDPNDDWMLGKGPSGCESRINPPSENELNKSWDQFSFETLSTQEKEAVSKKVLEKGHFNEKVEEKYVVEEITNGKRTNTSEMKRLRNSDMASELIPLKRSKTTNTTCKDEEVSNQVPKQNGSVFSKLWQVHDIDQIQTTRTRNSAKKIDHEPIGFKYHIDNYLNKPRRDSNAKRKSDQRHYSEIMPSVSSKVESNNLFNIGRRIDTNPSQELERDPKMTSCNTINRILRSARRKNEGSSVDLTISCTSVKDTKKRQSSRTKNETYFKKSRVNIVFTGFYCETLYQIISELGGRKVDDLPLGDVVVTDRIRRTVKFLCAIGLGLPITSPEWLLACRKEKKFLNPWNYILKDDSEEKWGFNLRSSLEQSKKKKFLKGFSVFATEKTKPPIKDLLTIVECCGGTPLRYAPEVWPKKTIIVSCIEDKESWPLKKFKHLKIVHYEFILSGVLKQKIDFKTYKLR